MTLRQDLDQYEVVNDDVIDNEEVDAWLAEPEHQEIVDSYNRLHTPHQRKNQLRNLEEHEVSILYRHYFLELERAIAAAEANRTLHANHAVLARNILEQVRSTHEGFFQKYDYTKILDYKLFDVLHATSDLIKTPAIIDQAENPAFRACARRFTGTMDRLKTEGKYSLLRGVGYALLTALVISAAVLLTVFTFGTLTLPLTFNVVALGLINVGGEIGLGIYTGAASFKFFNEAHKTMSFASKMGKLDTAMNLRG